MLCCPIENLPSDTNPEGWTTVVQPPSLNLNPEYHA